MGQQLAVVAVEAVYALRLRIAGRTYETEAPFAEGTGAVPGCLQVPENVLGARRQRKLAFGVQFQVASDGGVAAVGAGEEAGA